MTAEPIPGAVVHELLDDALEDLLLVMSRSDLTGPYLQSLAAWEVRELALVTHRCSLDCC